MFMSYRGKRVNRFFKTRDISVSKSRFRATYLDSLLFLLAMRSRQTD
ncbi:uncharacterized protein METZ01_LOCUS408982 [marine metagenome]|uniref:Uncharacterized protein n=1 Tax=marine metagenome TaxID=408172 RepID=A0A382WDE3_9ZZZZ